MIAKDAIFGRLFLYSNFAVQARSKPGQPLPKTDNSMSVFGGILWKQALSECKMSFFDILQEESSIEMRFRKL